MRAHTHGETPRTHNLSHRYTSVVGVSAKKKTHARADTHTQTDTHTHTHTQTDTHTNTPHIYSLSQTLSHTGTTAARRYTFFGRFQNWFRPQRQWHPLA